MKTSDNTHISEIDRFIHPATSTMIDRYVLASHWTKGKSVLDAAKKGIKNIKGKISNIKDGAFKIER